MGELPLIGVVVGALVGGAVLFVLSRRESKTIREGRSLKPEDRLLGAMAAAPLFAASMFWFAWTAEYNAVPWIVPTIAGAFLSVAILLIFATFINYLVDTYLAYAASAVAAIVSICFSLASLLSTMMLSFSMGTDIAVEEVEEGVSHEVDLRVPMY